MAEENQGTVLHGLLRVTAPSLFGRWRIAPIVLSFLKAHPGVRAELVLTNRSIDLIEEAVDIGIRIGRLTDSGLIARRVGQVRPVLSASPDYIARRGRLRTPRDLKNHDIVLISDPPRANEWRFRASGRELIVRLTPKFMVTEIEAALNAVRAGYGITRTLSYQVADDFSSGVLVRVLRGYELPVWPVHLVFPTARNMPHIVRAFLDVAAPALEALHVIHIEHP